MRRVRVHSRMGNLVLAAAGIVYAITGTALLIWLTIDVRGAAGMRDRLLQVSLAAAVICGVWMVLNSLANLREHPAQRRGARDAHEPALSS